MVGEREQGETHGGTRSFKRDRAFLLLSVVTVSGVALVAGGWVMQGASYVPGLLQQLGSSLMLLVPLAVLGVMLEKRLERTEVQLRATAAQLDTLTTVTRERLATFRRQQDDRFDAAKRAPTRDAVSAVLAEAEEMGAIASDGARVRLPGTELRLRFRARDGDVITAIEEADGTVLLRFPWNSGQSAESFAWQLAGVLRGADRYPGDGSYDPTQILRQLLDTVQLGVQSRSGELPRDFGQLIEIPNQHWAISKEGLYSLRQYYHIPAQRITGSHIDWPRHMRSLAWVDEAAFDEAYYLARRLLPQQH